MANFIFTQALTDAAGNLMLQGFVAGPESAETFGCTEVAFERTIGRAHVSRILVELFDARFHTDEVLGRWLKARNIPTTMAA